MHKKVVLVSVVACLAACFCADSRAQRNLAAESRVAGVASAAQKFLATLDDSQRSKAVFDFKDAEQRKRWSNLPVSSVPRAGLRMGDLTQPQREAALAVLKSALSAQGYEKVIQIVEADEALRAGAGAGGGGKAGGGKGGDGKGGGDKAKGDKAKGDKGKGGKGGAGASFGRDNYFISFLGQPSASEPFMIQFGGHHLGINITFAGENGTLTPSHTGAQPARFELEGKTVRPLGGEVDKAFALYSSLDDAQRKQATLGFEMRDLALGPGRDGQMIEPEGIKGSSLNQKQREMLVDLVSEWTGIIHDAAAATKLEEVKKNMSETWFAWSGPPEKGGAAYFRVHGPTAFIEFAPQRLGGDPTNHIHTIYRDPTNEYGAKWWKP